MLLQHLHRLVPMHAAGITPVEELDRVDAAVARLGLSDLTGRPHQFFRQLSLSEPGFLADQLQPGAEPPVARFVLGPGSIWARTSCFH